MHKRYTSLDSNDRRDGRRFVPQKTLARAVRCRGIGLHTGARVTMTLHPAEPNAGIRFLRSDIADAVPIPARYDRVVDSRMCTVLGDGGGVTVSTVEHLMAALAGLGLDNLMVELDGPEVPAMDGSAAPFMFLAEEAGLIEQASPKRVVRVLEPVSVEADSWQVALSPSGGFSIEMEIEFASRAIARQCLDLAAVNRTFASELARARTFGFLEEVEQLRQAGLARGGSLDNAVVVSGNHILNEEGLRFPDEFVRHKALDAVGDLYLAGAQIIGHFRGVCSGHAATNRLLHALFRSRGAWAWDTMRRGDISRRAIKAHPSESVAAALAV
ncbi:MAG: UDP-3-O-acyl-N-acetylglucosamine deacetylase [Rhodospirillales bacterium]|nr:MAG: UDP-3-O-acyl-N-acetylglucosamine deacetylase [Rhodospirillales bacterium]